MTILRGCTLAVLIILVAATAAVSQDVPIASGPVVVLDTSGFWRMYHTLKQPVVDLDSGVAPITLGKRWVVQGTADAPTGWTKPDFDDSAWLRGPARISILSPLLARRVITGLSGRSGRTARRPCSAWRERSLGSSAGSSEVGRVNRPDLLDMRYTTEWVPRLRSPAAVPKAEHRTAALRPFDTLMAGKLRAPSTVEGQTAQPWHPRYAKLQAAFVR